ncbi:hypothetical protein GCK72_008949 [Caenorhabditis remanei]|uniref:Uncharacterized protein n=1 Tax=Caenorhabditis remanei TaxID=31234 RepID=A0A6A5GYV5_CAERE|nr:hypothetical protein GCK72_008949 [Caenorhabditis remanei]KAF1760700.1 hypothetical protein GCK72_008949 [Caenorhabditis remanei]
MPIHQALFVASFVMAIFTYPLCFVSKHSFSIISDIILIIYYTIYSLAHRIPKERLRWFLVIEFLIFALLSFMVTTVLINQKGARIEYNDKIILFINYTGLILHIFAFSSQIIKDDRKIDDCPGTPVPISMSQIFNIS